MEVTARVSSKGQITIPRAVRDALCIKKGDEILFRLEGECAVMERIPNYLELAGFVDVPAEKRGTPWDEIRRETWKARAAARR